MVERTIGPGRTKGWTTAWATLGCCLSLCLMSGCAKSRRPAEATPDEEKTPRSIDSVMDGDGDGVFDDGDGDGPVVIVEGDGDTGEDFGDGDSGDGDLIVDIGDPPPPIEWTRSPGAAVLDIDPDQPSSWFMRIACEKSRACGLGGLELLTQEECEGLLGGACAPFAALPMDLVAPECIRRVEQASCDNLPHAFYTRACIDSITQVMSLLAGAERPAAEGEACGGNGFCDTGLACKYQGDGCGICAPVPMVGDPCPEQQCLGGYCAPETQRCTEYRPAGAPCTRDLECLMGCDLERHCRGWFNAEGVTSYCREDWECGGGKCRDGVCVPPAPLGAACVDDSDCALRRCHEGVCAISASCTPAAEGEYCTRQGFCQAPLLCNEGRCVSTGFDAPRQLGEPCFDGYECVSGNCQEGVCSLRPGGASCVQDDECQQGRCIFGICSGFNVGDCTTL